jgi:hypothetical protein
MPQEATFVYAHLNARILPMERGELYEDPLLEALETNGLGEVTGAGTMQAENGEIQFCGVDIDLYDLSQGIPFLCEFLTSRGAPKGSKLEYEVNGERVEVPFGAAEGLAIYFNGTDLPEEVYANCDINHVYDEINRLLDDRGAIQGHWQGPTETALYLYGYSAEEMKERIAEFMDEYPLCDRARYAQIA